MGKHYGKNIVNEVLKLKSEGKTHREISVQFNLTKRQIEKLVMRHKRLQRNLEAGILPRLKGRPQKGSVSPEKEKDNEIKQLKMENELLRSFLQIVGRK